MDRSLLGSSVHGILQVRIQDFSITPLQQQHALWTFIWHVSLLRTPEFGKPWWASTLPAFVNKMLRHTSTPMVHISSMAGDHKTPDIYSLSLYSKKLANSWTMPGALWRKKKSHSFPRPVRLVWCQAHSRCFINVDQVDWWTWTVKEAEVLTLVHMSSSPSVFVKMLVPRPNAHRSDLTAWSVTHSQGDSGADRLLRDARGDTGNQAGF